MRRGIVSASILAWFVACSSYGETDDESPVGPDASTDATAAEGSADAGGGTDAQTDAATRSEVYRAAILADNPIAYFRFEEESGSTTTDEMGTHVATLVFAPDLAAPGLFGPKDGIEFPKDSNAHILVTGNDLRFAGVSAFTIELWVYPAKFEDFQFLLSTEATSPRSGWSILTDGMAVPSWEQWPGNTRSIRVASAPLTLSKWQHLAFTYNGNVGFSFVDGVKKETISSSSPLPDTGTLMMGCRGADAGVVQCLDGWRLDEIAFYSTPLTEQRIKEHHDLGAPP